MSVAPPASHLRDAALPAFTELLGEGAADLLGTAAQAAFGAHELLECRPVQASWRPGRSLAVRYQLRYQDKRGPHEEGLVAYTGTELPARAVRLTSDEGEVAVWRIADDPWLPGLRVALEPGRVRSMLHSLGVPHAPVHLRLRAYRPGRRAVVEVETGGHHFFLKVVRPERVGRLQRRHRDLEPVLPVPPSHGWAQDAGLVVLRAMDGSTLKACLDRPDQAVPDPRDLGALLDRIPAIDDGGRTRSLLRTAGGHVELLRRLAPAAAPEIERMAEAFDRGAGLPAATLPVPVHGDLHESQILVMDGRISALLDVDTVTLGDRADDWALLIAHLDLHAQGAHGAVADRVRDYRDRVQAVALGEVDEPSLRLRIAASVFGQATGPFRVQAPAWATETRARLSRAMDWLESAE